MPEKIIWTLTDEAPALATYSLLPIVQKFTEGTGVEVETADISLASRILAQFGEAPDALSDLGALAKTREANIIKLPNISASIPQLQDAIEELRAQGHDLPDHGTDPAADAKYAVALGSAVNPVLREGNSDRRAPVSVKNYAKKHPHRLGPWTPEIRTRVATMQSGDFYANEQSVVMAADDTLTISLDGVPLKDGVDVLAGEIVDGTFLSVAKLRDYYAEQIAAAKDEGLLLSLHLKATMMKVSDPIMFGHAVSVFYGDLLDGTGANPNLGIGAIEEQLDKDRLAALYAERPALAMVDSDKGITNLHAPNDVIIDASMPVVIRDSGQMWNAAGEQQETLVMIPDRSYGPMYQAVIDDHKEHGALDPATIGTVPNVGLMAQKAEEYGSHPTTFEIPAAGTVTVTDSAGETLISHEVQAGDIWRMSRVRDIPVQDWVKLAVTRARATGATAVFYLDENRAHDRNVIAKVERYLADHDTEGLEILVSPPVEAIRICLERMRRGEDTISVTGNVLRDYLTDLFPILELGTSAKMLSIVPLLAGGGLFETGAGGSAPKHVQQFVKENYLRWDSLGEFSALGASLEHLAQAFDNEQAQQLADALDRAIATFLDEDRSPTRKLGGIDNRGSHFYLALYWAEELGSPLAAALRENEETIVAELNAVQGSPVDLGGYFRPDPAKAEAAMRPSQALNAILGG